MSYDDIQNASVIRYPFLWSHQAKNGETEGRKSRPTAVAFRQKKETGDAIFLLPITSKSPSDGTSFVEIPEIEKKRAGLDRHMRLWIIVEEYNYDIVEQSYYLEPDCHIGSFSPAFFKAVLVSFKSHFLKAKGAARNV